MFLTRHLGYKIILLVGLVTATALFFTGWFYSSYQEQSINEQNHRTLEKVINSVIQGLQTIMLVGYADVAQIYADRLKTVADVVDFRILRPDGLEAFRDNETIDNVNQRRGEEQFYPREEITHVPVLLSQNPELLNVLRSQSMVYYKEISSTREPLLTYLAPITNNKECAKCHGSDQPIRGVLKLTTSLAPIQDDIYETRIIAFAIMSVALILILTITGFVLFRTVIRPIGEVTGAMDIAATGNLAQRVPVFGQDEIGHMASSFNVMTDRLQTTYSGLQIEQDKLSTIILSAREGIIVTDGDQRIVLTNPAAEKFLNKGFDQLHAEGFEQIIDDPEKVNGWLMLEKHEPETVEYNNLLLDIYAATIKGPDGDNVGSAALIRDVTEEKRLEEELRTLSSTDALTGLYNRRFLDQTLEVQVERVHRYRNELTVLMFDVDHFKKFNDTYGHDQGDRVLQAIAEQMRDTLRNVDYPCRYGGEEFIGILPDTPKEGGMRVAERLRVAIEEMEVDNLKVTISIGVASCPPFEVTAGSQLVEIADKALYVAKDAGRNQVVFADPQTKPKT